MSDDDPKDNLLMLPIHQERFSKDAQRASLTPWSTRSYLLQRLAWELPPLGPALEEPLIYEGRVEAGGVEKVWGARESGILLLDRFTKRKVARPGIYNGSRIYLCQSNYTLLWQEWSAFRWRAWIRYMPLQDAVAAFGSLTVILEMLKALGARLSACTALPRYASQAGKLAAWCREAVKELA